MIKVSIQDEYIIILNTYAHNIGAPQYIRQTLTDIKREIDSNTVVGDFNTPLTPMDRWSNQKINNETQILNDTLDEVNLNDIFRIFHPSTEEYTLFSSAHRIFSRINHILGHKSNLSKFKKIKIIPSIFSNHYAMRLDINHKKKKIVRNTKTWRLNNIFLNNQWITEEIKREIKKFLGTNNNENTITQNLWDAAKAVLRGTFIAIQPYLEKQEKHWIDNLTLHPKQLEKE